MNYPHAIKLPSNRKFGLFFSAIFLVGFIRYFKEGIDPVAWTFAVLALVFAALTIAKPDVLLPLNKLWMRFGLLLGMVVSPIVLGVIFFALFMPIGFVMRVFRRDELRLQNKRLDSYWRIRTQGNVSGDSFKYQF